MHSYRQGPLNSQLLIWTVHFFKIIEHGKQWENVQIAVRWTLHIETNDTMAF